MITTDAPPAAAPQREHDVRGRRTVRLMFAALLAVGILVDLAIETEVDGFAAFLAVAVLAVALIGVGGITSLWGRGLVAAATLPAAFLFLRSSPWLVWVDLVAIGVLLAVGCSFARGGNLFDLSFGRLGSFLGRTVGSILEAPARLVEAVPVGLPTPSRASRRRWGALTRGVALALPLVIVLGLLLASADAVFASLLDLSVDLSRYPLHITVVALAVWVAAAFFVRAARVPGSHDRGRRFAIGATEGCLILAALIAVYALFACAQLLVALRSADYVVETTGLTSAEYARSGFFQLLWVAGLTLVVLLGLRGAVVHVTPRSDRTFRLLSVVAVALTLVIVHSAIVRLGLYEDAFGLTMLRLFSTVFAWWIGAVFVLTGLALAGLGARRQWLAGAVVCSALATLLCINVVNPEQRVVERNVDHAQRSGEYDVGYAVSLSDDSVPALVDALPSLPIDREAVLAVLCQDHEGDRATAWNLSARKAKAALDTVC